jgi:hypothetical protein
MLTTKPQGWLFKMAVWSLIIIRSSYQETDDIPINVNFLEKLAESSQDHQLQILPLYILCLSYGIDYSKLVHNLP